MDVKGLQIATIVWGAQNKMDTPSRKEISDRSIGLLMTYRCNLDCKYCYIHTKREKDMTLEMAQSILEPFLLDAGGLLDIKFMGGETLLASNVIIPLVEWIQKKEWQRPYRFFGSTNGTLLTKELKEWLFAHRKILTLGLSYDGIPYAQKINRTTAPIDLDYFVKTWPNQPIQMTINQESVGYMAEGIKYLLKKKALVHPNVAFEEDEWSEESISLYKQQLHELLSFYESNPHMPLITQFQHDLNEYADNLKNPPKEIQICGVGNGSLIFDTDGKSYNCHILSPLVLSKQKLEILNTCVLEGNQDIFETECYGCPYVSSCPTCIACNYTYRGNLLKRDHTHCAIMRVEVEVFLRKEIKRLKGTETLSSEDAAEIDSIMALIGYNKSKRK